MPLLEKSKGKEAGGRGRGGKSQIKREVWVRRN